MHTAHEATESCLPVVIGRVEHQWFRPDVTRAFAAVPNLAAASTPIYGLYKLIDDRCYVVIDLFLEMGGRAR